MNMKFSEQQLEMLKGGSQKHFVIYYHIGTSNYVVKVGGGVKKFTVEK